MGRRDWDGFPFTAEPDGYVVPSTPTFSAEFEFNNVDPKLIALLMGEDDGSGVMLDEQDPDA